MSLKISGSNVKSFSISSNISFKKYYFNGIRREVELSLVNAKIGDYVLIHAGYAIKVINEEDV
ncbi:MAG: HypC/HybG/HupF family hydrogenase formation chaperone [Acidianus sp.]|uniref:HypC/HybG/HupF family hydrogenase formation chaperone n=1 Tax=Acidianus sp. TaxID=1872104 RepID=UPI00397B1F67